MRQMLIPIFLRSKDLKRKTFPSKDTAISLFSKFIQLIFISRLQSETKQQKKEAALKRILTFPWKN